MEANRALVALELEPRSLAALLKGDAALRQRPLRVEESLMREAGLTQEEARRLYLLEIARWNYRAHVITYVGALSEAERQMFDGSIRDRLGTSRVSQIVYEQMKPGLQADIVKYVEALQSAV